MKLKHLTYSGLLLGGLLLGTAALAQNGATYLGPEEALRLALEQNIGRQISDENVSISRQNYTRGNAGFLPRVTAAGAKNWSVNNENLEIFGGDRIIETSRRGARSNNLNAGVTANWTVFDGLGMFYAYERLRLQYDASRQLNLNFVNGLAADVLQAYYRHTLQQQQVAVWESTLELSEQRLRLAKDRYEVGRSSKQEYLSALVDYNADRAALLAQQEALLNARHALNRLLGQQPARPLTTADTLTADSSLIASLMEPQPFTQNPELRAAEYQAAALQEFIKEQRSQIWPSINFNAGYNFATINNQVGNLLFRQASGFTYGISGTWLLFDGLNTRRTTQVARIQARIAELDRQQLELDLSSEQADATAAYRNSWQRVALEQENVEYARQNASIALDRYQLGVTTSLELRVAQQNAQQAELRLLNAVFELKLAEIDLLRITGQLANGL
ncbi:TolC family protein [Cesiribacter andamanensis]|uniref:Outer membrane protein oprM n=1 Tax=Cesiribacter andamanensis AMV16 TaxID=1279009 RepID=M7N2Z6_9BACT|nr:TolC family protein [Cesiribacter andamanensis]EMR01596.1 Outer membrane protein oprM precursor [Cesiribacter andamanensis AMV16]